MGVQDSGKTSLLNLVWGLQGSTGLFAHTDVPAMHRITSKVFYTTRHLDLFSLFSRSA